MICHRSVFGFLLSVSILLGASGTTDAHPFHASMTEAEWNAKTGKLEIALKVDPGDLEFALRKRTGRRIKLKDKSAEPFVAAYLNDSFRFYAPKKKSIPLEWVGAEISVKAAWLYFEVPLPDGLDRITIENRLLAHVPNQVNTVSLKQGTRRATLVFAGRKKSSVVRLEESNAK